MGSAVSDLFGARTRLAGHDLDYFRIAALDDAGVADTSRLPYTVRVLLEILLRNAGSIHVTDGDVRALVALAWVATAAGLLGLAAIFTPGLMKPLHRLASSRRLAAILAELQVMASTYRGRLGTVGSTVILSSATFVCTHTD